MRPQPPAQFLRDAIETQLMDRIKERNCIRTTRINPRGFEREINNHIVLQHHQGLGERQDVALRCNRLASLALYFVKIGKQRVERSKLSNQFGGRLDSNPAHARNIVNRVAHERQHVNHLVRSNPLRIKEFLHTKRLV